MPPRVPPHVYKKRTQSFNRCPQVCPRGALGCLMVPEGALVPIQRDPQDILEIPRSTPEGA